MDKKYKQNAFKTPEGYFDELPGKLLAKLEEGELGLPKEEGFTVPKGYFEGLEDQITEKASKPEPKVISLRSYRKYYFAAASVAAAILLVFGLQLNKTEAPSFENLANTEITDYFENNDLGMSSYEIAEVLSVEELEMNDILEDELNEENIIDYLDENIDDLDELNFESDEQFD